LQDHVVCEIVGMKGTGEVLEQRQRHGADAGGRVREVAHSHQVLMGAAKLGALSFKHAGDAGYELVQQLAITEGLVRARREAAAAAAPGGSASGCGGNR
jgi:hypothetical protein